ncbi:MAG: Nif3-like dinuclear metal center hexameric protein [Solirubrobacteraceae bacterium]|nr:Nif3-like dinuclear metal center hexameric protein [Solirubrobacteraceae bacterium]
MASRDEIVAFLDALLDSANFEDYGPNGLQVPGREEVRHVVTGVSANRALIEEAARLEADLLLVHHGLFWPSIGPIDALTAGRLRPLFVGDISLAAYHLPLDAHEEVGNNALIADALGLTDRRTFAPHRGRHLGIAGHLPSALSPSQFADLLAGLIQRPLAFAGGPERISTVGVVSGGAADDITEAAALGLDAFVTGEPAERSQGMAEELGVHFFAAGHHATERFGIRELGERVAAEFAGVQHTFVDIANPV